MWSIGVGIQDLDKYQDFDNLGLGSDNSVKNDFDGDRSSTISAAGRGVYSFDVWEKWEEVNIFWFTNWLIFDANDWEDGFDMREEFKIRNEEELGIDDVIGIEL